LINDLFKVTSSNRLELVASNGDISISNLSFGYEEDNPILEDVSLNIKRNAKYLIIGPSGKGKSTLLKILGGYIANYQGEVLINNQDYKSISESSLLSIINYVDQYPYVFNLSIRDNIDLNHSYSDEEVLEVLKKVQLEEYITTYGLDHIVNSQTTTLSGGELQRLCLARALLYNHSVLLLDEITSSLDLANTTIIESIISELKDKTLLYVCHKVNDVLIKKFDYIIDFKEKKINIIASSDYII
jgi:ABC-type multidrug transport system fused ATPase/permease subunit